MRKLSNLWLYLIVTIAIVLRVLFFWHGHPFVFHPDEPTVVRSALEVRFYPNPGHFDWPHLYIYINYIVYMIFAFVRNILSTSGLVTEGPLFDETTIFYYLTRVLSGVLGGLTVIPVYLTAKTFFNSSRVGLLAGLVIALMPLHVWNSHLALIDVPMIFFVSWVLYFGAQIYTTRNLRYYILAGIFVGLAASTKYHGAFSGIFIAVVHFIDYKSFWKNLRELYKAIIAGIVSLLGFLVGTPYALIDFTTFIRTDGPKGALWQFTNVGHVPFTTQVGKFIYNLFIRIPDDIGYTFAVVLVLGLIYFLFSKTFSKGLFLFYTMYLFLVFYISGFEKSRSHYLMISYPFIAVVVGYMLEVVSVKFSKVIKYLVLFLVFIVPLGISIWQNYILSKEDTRVQLYHWVLRQGVVNNSYNYSSNNLNIIWDKISTNNVNRVLESSYLPSSSSYYIISEEDSVTALDKFNDLPGTVKTLETFSPINRRGPVILIAQ